MDTSSITKRSDPLPTIAHVTPQVVRCECAVCGAHTNGVKTFRVIGSCPNCGSFDLTPIVGAAPLSGPVAA